MFKETALVKAIKQAYKRMELSATVQDGFCYVASKHWIVKLPRLRYKKVEAVLFEYYGEAPEEGVQLGAHGKYVLDKWSEFEKVNLPLNFTRWIYWWDELKLKLCVFQGVNNPQFLTQVQYEYLDLLNLSELLAFYAAGEDESTPVVVKDLEGEAVMLVLPYVVDRKLPLIAV